MPGEFEVLQAQRVLRVKPVDQMLDVGRGILRMHQAGDRIFQLAPVDDHGRVHREEFVLACMVDMQVRVQHVAHIAHPHAVFRELVLDHVLVELEAAHAEALHDLVVAIAGIDHDGPGSAQDQKAIGRHTARATAIAPQHEEARFKLDIAIVEHLDFQSHLGLLIPSIGRAGRPGARFC